MSPHARSPHTSTGWDACDLECSHCGSGLSRHPAKVGAYYSCPRCDRTYASTYDEVLRKHAGVRPASATRRLEPTKDPYFQRVKSRLEAFLRRLDEEDAWFVLGVAPGAPLETVRARYRELALLHHPDRGGDPQQMQRITGAFEAIRSGAALPNPGPRGIKAPPVGEEDPATTADSRERRQSSMATASRHSRAMTIPTGSRRR